MKTRHKGNKRRGHPGGKSDSSGNSLVLLQVDPETGETTTWPSIASAATNVKVKGRATQKSTFRTKTVQISACCTGIRSLALGYLWVWIDASKGLDPTVLKSHVEYATSLRYLQTVAWTQLTQEQVMKTALYLQSLTTP